MLQKVLKVKVLSLAIILYKLLLKFYLNYLPDCESALGGKILPLPDETLTGALDWSESILSLCFEGESERGI
jgi:hypothetical protein